MGKIVATHREGPWKDDCLCITMTLVFLWHEQALPIVIYVHVKQFYTYCHLDKGTHQNNTCQ